jgi:hypothetical protein
MKEKELLIRALKLLEHIGINEHTIKTTSFESIITGQNIDEELSTFFKDLNQQIPIEYNNDGTLKKEYYDNTRIRTGE